MHGQHADALLEQSKAALGKTVAVTEEPPVISDAEPAAASEEPMEMETQTAQQQPADFSRLSLNDWQGQDSSAKVSSHAAS